MRRFIPLVILLTLFQMGFGGYMYVKGGIDGIAMYRRSKSFYLTLYSMYRFGFMDGAATCK
jgi:hypothetical protein